VLGLYHDPKTDQTALTSKYNDHANTTRLREQQLIQAEDLEVLAHSMSEILVEKLLKCLKTKNC
jgi:hypothetical protein